jgi:hypothetical protein
LISGLVHFAFLYEAYPPTSTGGFLANQNVWMEDTCSAKKMYIAYEPSPLVVKMMQNPVQFDAF